MSANPYEFNWSCHIPPDHEFMESITENTIFKYQHLDPCGKQRYGGYTQIEDSLKDNYTDGNRVETIPQDAITVIKKVLEKNPALNIEELEPSRMLDEDITAVFLRDNEKTNTIYGDLYERSSDKESSTRIINTIIHEIFGVLDELQ